MKNIIMKYLFFLPVSAFILSGCATVPDKPIREKTDHGLYENTEPVLMLDKKIRKFLYHIEDSSSRTEDGRLTVSSKFINKTKGKLEVQIQTVFKDENGEMTDQTNWELVLVPSGSYYYYKAASLNSKAKDYTIKCRSVTTKGMGVL
ncbi:MAG: hypothetical protein HQL30_12405 [Candidatus Omnitrophica bacterium]|nr:hypothetical protein [Candidatus Omnitrophota bacterium]